MTTEAQVAANRLNAQKSTGPRTAEGKAAVAQNAVQHGLFAREGVIRGEDEDAFQRHRERLLAQLNPVGPLEEILADRIVDLAWRLQRAVRDQEEAFVALYERHVTAQAATGPDSASGTGILPVDLNHGQDAHATTGRIGRMILEDFSDSAVLDRLLKYERRIESSLYRTLNQLRRVHDQVQMAALEDASILERWRQEDDEARKEWAFARCRPADGPSWQDGETTGTLPFEVPQPYVGPSWPDTCPSPDAPAGDEMCKTNPNEVSSEEWQVASEVGRGRLTLDQIEGKLHEERPRDPRVTGVEAQTRSCETNPMCVEPNASQVPRGTAVTSDSISNGLRQTNPIPEEVSSLKCQVSGTRVQAATIGRCP